MGAINTKPTYEIKGCYGTLHTFGNGWATEVNLVSWNEAEPKIDIRDWSPDHKRLLRGMTFTKEEAEAVQRILKRSLPSKRDFPTETPGDFPGEVTFKIIMHLGVISVNEAGWSKEVNIVSWNDMAPKVEIRNWSPDHERMTRGISFDRDAAEALSKLDLDNPK